MPGYSSFPCTWWSCNNDQFSAHDLKGDEGREFPWWKWNIHERGVRQIGYWVLNIGCWIFECWILSGWILNKYYKCKYPIFNIQLTLHCRRHYNQGLRQLFIDWKFPPPTRCKFCFLKQGSFPFFCLAYDHQIWLYHDQKRKVSIITKD